MNKFAIMVGVVMLLTFSVSHSQITDTLVDKRDGQKYSVVKIGSQWWMKENLNYAVEDGSWVYDHDTSNAAIYGRLYNWETASKVCPDGWHLPSRAEWEELKDYLGGKLGGKLKETGTTHWKSPNTGATNETGFTALPGGYWHDLLGKFDDIGETGDWWSSSENTKFLKGKRAYGRRLYYLYADDWGHGTLGDKNDRLSVRCVRD